MAEFKEALIFRATWRPGVGEAGGRGLFKFWPLAPLWPHPRPSLINAVLFSLGAGMNLIGLCGADT